MIDELQKVSPNQGLIKDDTEGCMSYNNKDKKLADAMSSFNHSLQDCWYYSKQNTWPPGGGSVARIKNDCAKVYGNGVNPEGIETEERDYVCQGKQSSSPPSGYVGRCWNKNSGVWVPDSNECVDSALKDYCGILEIR